ncbi:hypothetical protein ACF3MZ_26510 [Paenibacillaceae bacterium WGS1546]|uniref:hypothetical protein n=1 Tax=Cohnella sp. WGS1546 TaxID=3366810 RepID=UPI00372D198F
MKRGIAWGLAVLMWIPVFNFGGGKAEASGTWSQSEFIISTFQGVGEDHSVYPTLMQKMKDLGLNTTELYFLDRNDSLEALAAADTVGMKVIVNELGDKAPLVNRFSNFQNKIYGTNSDSSIADAISFYSGHPSLYGYAVWDEPFPENIAAAKTVIGKFKAQAPDRLALIGALPRDTSGTFASLPQWTAYIDDYVDQIDLQVMGFDYYPFAEVDAGTPLEQTNVFENLGYIRQKALQKNIPIWNYIQSVGNLNETTIGSMTVDKIRLQVYYSLAYGAKAISYYNVRSGLLTDTGAETALFNGTRQINEELKKLGPTLIGLTSTGIYQTGNVYHPFDDDLNNQSLIESLPGDMLLGTFLNFGRPDLHSAGQPQLYRLQIRHDRV